jgi:hypothetical protein
MFDRVTCQIMLSLPNKDCVQAICEFVMSTYGNKSSYMSCWDLKKNTRNWHWLKLIWASADMKLNYVELSYRPECHVWCISDSSQVFRVSRCLQDIPGLNLQHFPSNPSERVTHKPQRPVLSHTRSGPTRTSTGGPKPETYRDQWKDVKRGLNELQRESLFPSQNFHNCSTKPQESSPCRIGMALWCTRPPCVTRREHNIVSCQPCLCWFQAKFWTLT